MGGPRTTAQLSVQGVEVSGATSGGPRSQEQLQQLKVRCLGPPKATTPRPSPVIPRAKGGSSVRATTPRPGHTRVCTADTEQGRGAPLRQAAPHRPSAPPGRTGFTWVSASNPVGRHKSTLPTVRLSGVSGLGPPYSLSDAVPKPAHSSPGRTGSRAHTPLLLHPSPSWGCSGNPDRPCARPVPSELYCSPSLSISNPRLQTRESGIREGRQSVQGHTAVRPPGSSLDPGP